MEEVERLTPLVRRLLATDLEAIVAIDAQSSGHRREEYLQLKLKESLEESGIQVSLAAESDGTLVGFLLARVYHGEFGSMERVAVLDTIGVHPGFRGQGVGLGLLEQLRMNLSGLCIRSLRTEVDWRDQNLISFFHHQGFQPAARLCLDLTIDAV